MTKLPDEILIDEIYKELIEYIYEVEHTELLVGSTIKSILQKHLTHPTDEGIEKPTNYDAACMYVISKWLPINKDDVLWILKAAGKEVEGIEKEEPTIDNEFPYCQKHSLAYTSFCKECAIKASQEEVKPPTKDRRIIGIKIWSTI